MFEAPRNLGEVRSKERNRMWESKSIVRTICQLVLDSVAKEDLSSKQLPAELCQRMEETEAGKLMLKAVKRICAPFRRYDDGIISQKKAAEEIKDAVISSLCPVAKQIEKTQKWNLVCDFYEAAHKVAQETSLGFDVFAIAFAKAIHMLVGDEHRFLIGTRDNKPVWRMGEYSPSRKVEVKMEVMGFSRGSSAISSVGSLSGSQLLGSIPQIGKTGIIEVPCEDQLLASLVASILDENMMYVDNGVADLVPSPKDWVTAGEILSLASEWDADWEEINQILIEAFCNQYYVLGPYGAEVQITGCDGVESMTLRARGGLRDGKAVDLFAKVILSGGKNFFFVLDSTTPSLGQSVSDRVKRFFYKIMASVYRDLVVRDEAEQVWRARTVRAHEDGVRTRLKEPRVVNPHPVKGHKRKGTMSAKQKQACIDAERKYGANIIAQLPPENTYVLPFGVPRISGEEFAQLSYIVQHEIRKSIEADLVSTGKS